MDVAVRAGGSKESLGKGIPSDEEKGDGEDLLPHIWVIGNRKA